MGWTRSTNARIETGSDHHGLGDATHEWLQAAHELRALKVPTPIVLFTMYADAVQPQNRSDVNAVVYKLDTVELQRQLARLLHQSSLAS
jgi:hypothetical protein